MGVGSTVADMNGLRVFFLKLMVLGLGMLFITTIPPAKAVTFHEMTTWFECNSPSVGQHERYSCDRVGLYIMGECEAGREQAPQLCEMVTKYIQDNGLQNERHITQAEVAEDFRIISKTETEEEKTFIEKFFDDAPNFQNGDENNK